MCVFAKSLGRRRSETPRKCSTSSFFSTYAVSPVAVGRQPEVKGFSVSKRGGEEGGRGDARLLELPQQHKKEEEEKGKKEKKQ